MPIWKTPRWENLQGVLVKNKSINVLEEAVIRVRHELTMNIDKITQFSKMSCLMILGIC